MRRRVAWLGSVLLVCGLAGPGAASALAAGGHGSRAFASLPHLGPAPQRCELGQTGVPSVHGGHELHGSSRPAGRSTSARTSSAWVIPSRRRRRRRRAKCRIQWGSPPGTKRWRAVETGRQGDQPQGGRHDSFLRVRPAVEGRISQRYPPDAKAPGGGWEQFEVGFCAFVGCAQLASDFYYVLPHKKAISGKV